MFPNFKMKTLKPAQLIVYCMSQFAVRSVTDKDSPGRPLLSFCFSFPLVQFYLQRTLTANCNVIVITFQFTCCFARHALLIWSPSCLKNEVNMQVSVVGVGAAPIAISFSLLAL